MLDKDLKNGKIKLSLLIYLFFLKSAFMGSVIPNCSKSQKLFSRF